MNIVSIEGIAGSGKSLFGKKLAEKIEEHYPSLAIKNYNGHNNMGPLMDRLVLGNACEHLSPYTLQITDLYLFIEKELAAGWLKKDVVLFKQFAPSLYARLKTSGFDTGALEIFNRFPANITFVLECDPLKAYENCTGQRAVSYWETDFYKGLSMDKVRDGIIAFYRGEIPVEEIRESFISYYTEYHSALLEFLHASNYVVIPESLALNDKVALAFEHVQKILLEMGQ